MSYVLTATWAEPTTGSAVWVCALTAAEATTVQTTIDWLKGHADDQWGDTLPAWRLEPTQANGGDLLGLVAVLAEIRLQSRYSETDEPGEYYGGECPELAR